MPSLPLTAAALFVLAAALVDQQPGALVRAQGEPAYMDTALEWPPGGHSREGDVTFYHGPGEDQLFNYRWSLTGQKYGNGEYTVQGSQAYWADDTADHRGKPPSALFDKRYGPSGVPHDGWHNSWGGHGLWAFIKLPAAVQLVAYELVAYNGTSMVIYTPTGWVLEGSDDGATWTALDTVAGETWVPSVNFRRRYLGDAGPMHNYYRIDFGTADAMGLAYLQVWELRLFSSPDFDDSTPDPATAATYCADETTSCTCSGTVYYGRKFQDTSAPGSGAVATFKEALDTPYLGVYVDGSIACTDAAIGSLLPGFDKGCWCVPAEELSMCAAVDGPVHEIKYGQDSSFCLSGAPAVGAYGAVTIQTCDGSDSQKWMWDPTTQRIAYAPNPAFCLDSEVSTPADGALVGLHACSGAAGQMWSWDTLDKRLREAALATYCVNLQSGVVAHGTAAELWTCSSSTQTFVMGDARWPLDRAVSDIQHSGDRGFCLGKVGTALQSATCAAGDALVLQPCDSSARQKWEWDQSSGQIRYAYDPSFCVNLPGDSQVDNQPLELDSCTTAASMQWHIDDMTDSVHPLSNAAFCVNLKNNAHADGTVVDLYTCTDHISQSWVKSTHLGRHWAPDPTAEADDCVCDGSMYYGHLHAAGDSPGEGAAPITLATLAGMPYSVSWNRGTRACGPHSADWRGHNDPYAFKACYCARPVSERPTGLPVADATSFPLVCAEEGGACACDGTVYYGRKHEGGLPASGPESTFAEMLTSPYTATRVPASVTCDATNLGEPLAGFGKRCWCAPRGHETICAAAEGDACTCDGTVYFGRKHADDATPPGTGAITDFPTLSESFGAGTYAAKWVEGSIPCTAHHMGSDPLPKFLKHCFCVQPVRMAPDSASGALEWPPSGLDREAVASQHAPDNTMRYYWSLDGNSYGNGAYEAWGDSVRWFDHYVHMQDLTALFDKDPATVSATDYMAAATDYRVGVSLPEAVELWSYELDSGVDARAGYLPVDWDLEASSDGASWTLLDARRDVRFTWDGMPTYRFYVPGSVTPSHYRHYRFTFLDIDTVHWIEYISQLRLFSSPSALAPPAPSTVPPPPPPPAVDLGTLLEWPPGAIDRTTDVDLYQRSAAPLPGFWYRWRVAGQPHGNGDYAVHATQVRYAGGEGSERSATGIFDKDTAEAVYKYWSPDGVGANALQIRLPAQIKLQVYTLSQMNTGYAAYLPWAWDVAASNDGTTWTVIDSIQDHKWQKGWMEKEFYIDSAHASTHYSMFRLNIPDQSATHASSAQLILAEWRLFSDADVVDLAPDPDPSPPPLVISPAMKEWPPVGHSYSADVTVSGTTHTWDLTSVPYGAGTYIATTDTNIYSGFTLSGLFDKVGGPSTNEWIRSSAATSPSYVAIELPEAIVLAGYELVSRTGCCALQSPHVWDMEASNDGATWTTLQSVTAPQRWIGFHSVVNSYAVPMSNMPYSHYRLAFPDASLYNVDWALALSEWRLYSRPSRPAQGFCPASDARCRACNCGTTIEQRMRDRLRGDRGAE